MSGQPVDVKRFFLFNTIVVLTNTVAQSMGLLIGAAAPSLEASTFIGQLLSPFDLLTFCLLNSFFLFRSNLRNSSFSILRFFHQKSRYDGWLAMDNFNFVFYLFF